MASVCDGFLEIVSILALPPDRHLAACLDHGGGEVAVAGWVPPRGNVGPKGRQIVGARNQYAADALLAATARFDQLGGGAREGMPLGAP